jgi:RES domain-containing protein
VNLYRLTRQKYATDLSGEGAKLFGGRWNSKGSSMLYTSTTRSLAILELLVNTDKQFIPKDLVMVILEMHTDIILEAKQLPKNWQEIPAPMASQKWGDAWLASETFGVYVPSVIVPQEQNVLLNPKYVQFIERVSVVDFSPFTFDTRLF